MSYLSVSIYLSTNPYYQYPNQHSPGPGKQPLIGLSPGFYFPFSTILCCWINLPREQPQSYPMLSYLYIIQYTLPHNHLTYYHRPRATQYMFPYNHHILSSYSTCHVTHTITAHAIVYHASHNHSTYKHCNHSTSLKDNASPPIVSMIFLPCNSIEVRVFLVVR